MATKQHTIEVDAQKHIANAAKEDQKKLVLAAIKEAAELVKPIVAKIERGVPLTKYHYAKYLELLSRAPSDQRKLLALALLEAGANQEGVAYALNFLKS